MLDGVAFNDFMTMKALGTICFACLVVCKPQLLSMAAAYSQLWRFCSFKSFIHSSMSVFSLCHRRSLALTSALGQLDALRNC